MQPFTASGLQIAVAKAQMPMGDPLVPEKTGVEPQRSKMVKWVA